MREPVRLLVVDCSLRFYQYLLVRLTTVAEARIVRFISDGAALFNEFDSEHYDLLVVHIGPAYRADMALFETTLKQPCPVLAVTEGEDGFLAVQLKQKGAAAVQSSRQLQELSLEALIRKFRYLIGPSYDRVAGTVAPVAGLQNKKRMIGIAASAGGPKVIAEILHNLISDFPFPVLIAQHNTEGFSDGMVVWLNTLSSLPVVTAEHDMLLEPGVVYLAPSKLNLMVVKGKCVVQSPPKDQHYQPSCDLLFESIALECGEKSIGIILSGMGVDGVLGLVAIKRSGGLTLAQDEEGCAVFGMPKAAIERGCITRSCRSDEIARHLNKLATEELAAQKSRGLGNAHA